jgi:hypothetical protein
VTEVTGPPLSEKAACSPSVSLGPHLCPLVIELDGRDRLLARAIRQSSFEHLTGCFCHYENAWDTQD